MNNELEKIDLIRERTGASYRDAKKALDEADGDVVRALVNLEEGGKLEDDGKEHGEKDFLGQKQILGNELMDNIKDVLQRGQATRIRIKQGDRTVFEVPASVGAVGLIAALASSHLALLGALGSVAAMSKQYTLEFDKPGKNAQGEPGAEKTENKESFIYRNEPLQ